MNSTDAEYTQTAMAYARRYIATGWSPHRPAVEIEKPRTERLARPAS
jgi:hypothetical protein